MSAERYIPLFRYVPRSSPVHRTPATVKLLVLISLAPAVFYGPVYLLVAITAFLAVLFPLARIEVPVIIRSFRVILQYGLFVLAFRLIGKPLQATIILSELHESLFYLWRLSDILMAGTIFYESTSGSQIRSSLSLPRKLLIGFAPRLARLPDIAFELSLTIIMIPRVFDVWTNLDRAWAARGGNLSPVRPGIPALYLFSPLAVRIRKMRILLPLLFIQLFEMAVTTARAISNRSE